MNKLLLFFVFCIPFQLQADAINTEAIFSDSYEGYLHNEKDIYWYEESSYKVTSYITPDITAQSVTVELNPICIEGGGGDCAMGVLYKKEHVDEKGNHFFIVKDKTESDVWIQSNEWSPRNFDKNMINNNGMDLILSDGFDTTDTSIKDGVPNLENERNKKMKEILRPFSSKLGDIRIELPGDTKVLRVKDSHVKPDGQFLDYPLSTESYYFREDMNRYVIETKLFKRKGNYMVVELYAGPDIFMEPALTVKDYTCAGPNTNYVWLDTKGMDIEYIKADVYYPPIESLLGEFGRSYSVKEIKIFNGNSYALIEEHLSVLNPFVTPDENRAKRDSYTLPYKWIKIRDNKNRLRFWFASYSC